MSRNASIAISAAAVLAACAFIFFMSSRAGGDSGALSRVFVDFAVQHLVPGYGQMSPVEQLAWYDGIHLAVRKLAHFSEFALLGALAANLTTRLANTKTTCAPPEEREQARANVERPASGTRSAIENPAPRESVSASGLAKLKPHAIAWAFSIVYAASDEVHQLFVPGRACMPLDVLIDASGALAGIAAFALAARLLAQTRHAKRDRATPSPRETDFPAGG